MAGKAAGSCSWIARRKDRRHFSFVIRRLHFAYLSCLMRFATSFFLSAICFFLLAQRTCFANEDPRMEEVIRY